MATVKTLSCSSIVPPPLPNIKSQVKIEEFDFEVAKNMKEKASFIVLTLFLYLFYLLLFC